MKSCQFCANEIQDAAVKCQYCGEFQSAPVKAKKKRSGFGCVASILGIIVGLGLAAGGFASSLAAGNPEGVNMGMMVFGAGAVLLFWTLLSPLFLRMTRGLFRAITPDTIYGDNLTAMAMLRFNLKHTWPIILAAVPVFLIAAVGTTLIYAAAFPNAAASRPTMAEEDTVIDGGGPSAAVAQPLEMPTTEVEVAPIPESTAETPPPEPTTTSAPFDPLAEPIQPTTPPTNVQ